jgi:hypothetical protein
MTGRFFLTMKNIKNYRFFPPAAVILVAALVCLSCSSDSPVNLDNGNLLKDRSCFDYSDYLHTTGGSDTRGRAIAVAISRGIAAVADGAAGVQLVDIIDVRAPVLRGAVDTTGTALDIVATGFLFWVAYGRSGLIVVDGGDPDRPVIVGGVPTPGEASGIALKDTIACVADATIGLMIFDISDPRSPAPMGVENTAGIAVDVAIAGDLAYVADRTLGLRVVNIVDPEAPWLVNTVPMPAVSMAVALAGGIAYVATREAGVQFVDITVPGSESITGFVDTPGSALGVVLDGSDLYVADSFRGMRIFDVSSTDSPVAINHVSYGGTVRGIALDGNLACVAEDGNGLRLLNVRNPSAPPELASMEWGARFNDSTVLEVASGPAGSYAVTSAALLGVELDETRLDVSTLDLTIDAVDIAVGEGFVYLAGGGDGIQIIDVSDPSAPADAGFVPYIGNVVAAATADSLVYFATGGEQFGVYRQDGALYTISLAGGLTSAVCFNGGYCYVASLNQRMNIVDVQNPSALASLGLLMIDGSGVEVLYENGFVYVVTMDLLYGGVNGVAIYDAPYPFILRPLGSIGLPTQPRAAAVAGGILYVALGQGGVEVIDVSDAANPVRIGAIASADLTNGLAVDNGALFVADGDGGLNVFHTQECPPAN